ncbi:hypothetical protein GJ744_001596 [Endocarpon pusillum]|uniref:Uncharacterized protein n=1 Tax=Endocarpon pusillum TaxID=364733 RepID=A0A8H7ACG8_9EURO|nr:hypothetical protein GJ744_001596 [Endocarpon pusillum]
MEDHGRKKNGYGSTLCLLLEGNIVDQRSGRFRADPTSTWAFEIAAADGWPSAHYLSPPGHLQIDKAAMATAQPHRLAFWTETTGYR